MAVGRREALRDGIVFEFLYSFFVFFTFKSLSHLEFIQMDSILSYFKHLLKFSFRAARDRTGIGSEGALEVKRGAMGREVENQV